ncbi:MAG: hypothetical protein ACRELY_13000 [Polyangiaceae bacterium]
MKTRAPALVVFAFAPVLVSGASCKPDFAERDSLVTEERVLAMQAEPAEAKPGTAISYSLLVASPNGTVQNAGADWAFCTTPSSLTENDSVSPDCLKDGVAEIGSAGEETSAATPGDACSIFGPDTPPGQIRPRDADATGGFFQPVRAEIGSIVAFGFARITCDLPNAPASVTIDFNERYVANRNPAPPVISASVAGASVDFASIPANARVTFRATWTADDAESFVVYDPSSVSVVDARESIRVSWFASGGSFDADRTGRDASDTTTFTENGWAAPSSGIVHLWVVMRDSRGGVSFAGADLTVK